MKRNSYFIVLALFIILPNITLAATEELISLDNPEIIKNYINKTYEIVNIDLRLPEYEERIFNEKAESKLMNLVSIYEPYKINNTYNLLENDRIEGTNFYRLTIEKNNEDNVLLLEPLPGVSVNAEYDKNEDNLMIEENANISLRYWMNNRTLLRAEYGRENREWWDIANINLIDRNKEDSSREEDNDGNLDEGNNNQEDPDANEGVDREPEEIDYDNSRRERTFEEMAFYEERYETGRVGISYKTNDYLTISADYINDLNTLSRGYSTIIGVEYKDDDLGSLRYHYQLDRGNENARATGLEFGYKDLATFNATYKIYNPETIEEQLNQWVFGIGLNLNDTSTFSFEYLLKQDNYSETLLTEEDKDESNIKAQLEIKF